MQSRVQQALAHQTDREIIELLEKEEKVLEKYHELQEHYSERQQHYIEMLEQIGVLRRENVRLQQELFRANEKVYRDDKQFMLQVIRKLQQKVRVLEQQEGNGTVPRVQIPLEHQKALLHQQPVAAEQSMQPPVKEAQGSEDLVVRHAAAVLTRFRSDHQQVLQPKSSHQQPAAAAAAEENPVEDSGDSALAVADLMQFSHIAAEQAETAAQQDAVILRFFRRQAYTSRK